MCLCFSPGPTFHLSKTEPQSFPQTCSHSGGLPQADDKCLSLSPLLILARPPQCLLHMATCAAQGISTTHLGYSTCQYSPPRPRLSPWKLFFTQWCFLNCMVLHPLGAAIALSIELKPLKGQGGPSWPACCFSNSSDLPSPISCSSQIGLCTVSRTLHA